MAKVRIGVSGWNYDHWKGDVYPDHLPRDRWLDWISRRFSTVEANGPFYSLLSPHSYRSWYEATPPGFRFALKGSRFITHNKKLADVRRPLANFLASGVLALGEKLGPLLWQLSPRHVFDATRLASFLDLLPKDTESAARLARDHDGRVEDAWLDVEANHRLRHVIEARHESFFTPEAISVLRKGGVALAISHASGWPMAEELTAGFVYVRLHGAPRTYESGYSGSELERWAARIRAWSRGSEPEDARRVTDRAPPARKGRDVYVYFDNDAVGRAPRDALALCDRLKERIGA